MALVVEMLSLWTMMCPYVEASHSMGLVVVVVVTVFIAW